MDPTRIEIEALPGTRIRQTITFWNGTDGELPIHVAAGDVAQDDEEGHANVAEEDAANSVKSWITPAIPDLYVLPKVEISLDFTIDVPSGADPGSHWGALLVTTAPQSIGGGAAIRTTVGTIILVRVLGESKEKLSLESFSVPQFLQGPPLDLEARFKNEGTVHEAPQGTIEVRNMFGMLASTSTLPERNVLPGSVRKITTSVGGGLWLGRYTVLLHATYGDAGEELSAKEVVWVVPWRTQGWKVVVAILVIVFTIWKRRNFGAFWHVLKTGLPPPPEEIKH